MIFACLNCLAEEMNLFFKNKLKIHEDKVVVSAIIHQDGSIAIQGENKVAVTLVNVIRDTNLKRDLSAASTIRANMPKPIGIQLYVMVSCYFSGANYTESLRFLSFVIGFLQEKNVFDHTNTPGLDESLDKLVFEMESFEPERLTHIWSALGAKYMPSVLYKVRLILYDSNKISEYRPQISGIVQDNSQ